MYKIQPQKRFQFIQYYINNDTTLKQTAKKYNVHYQSVFKWVKLYKKLGEERLYLSYKKPWNRTKKELEEKIIQLKEQQPTLTIRKTKEILGKEGIKITIKGIWGVWKRYGYAGFKNTEGHDFTEYCSWTEEAREKFDNAKRKYELGKIEESVNILNSIPFIPKNELLYKIPDKFLNLKRRIEKTPALFEKMPLPSYLCMIGELFNELISKELNYSAIRVGIIEIMALAWSGNIKELLVLSEQLKKIMTKQGNYFSYLLFEPYFLLLTGESIAYIILLEIKKAFETAKLLSRLLKRRKVISPHFMLNLGILYMNLEDYIMAEFWISKVLNILDENSKKQAIGALAYIYLFKGDYKKAIITLKKSEFGGWVLDSKKLIFRSLLSLINGKPQRIIPFITEALLLLKKEEIMNEIGGATSIIASAYCCLCERDKAMDRLREIKPFLEKNKYKRGLLILDNLVSQISNLRIRIPINKNMLPSVNLVLLLRNRNYWRALSYAKKKGILIYFYKYLFFFPDIVSELLESGKNPCLPKAILKLPVFNKEVPVYYIKFLGNLTVYKNQRYLKVKLQPKDSAFLIHISLKLGEPNKSIPLESLYMNFWKYSKNPSRNLSHLLVRIKKSIKIPSHLLEVSNNNSFLINNGIHFITDYEEFQQLLAQAKTMLRAGEWSFAKKKYKSAFSLFKEKPFRKIYDNWSEDKRNEILNSYEKEILSFLKECVYNKEDNEMKEMLKKSKKIFPYLNLKR